MQPKVFVFKLFLCLSLLELLLCLKDVFFLLVLLVLLVPLVITASAKWRVSVLVSCLFVFGEREQSGEGIWAFGLLVWFGLICLLIVAFFERIFELPSFWGLWSKENRGGLSCRLTSHVLFGILGVCGYLLLQKVTSFLLLIELPFVVLFCFQADRLLRFQGIYRQLRAFGVFAVLGVLGAFGVWLTGEGRWVQHLRFMGERQLVVNERSQISI